MSNPIVLVTRRIWFDIGSFFTAFEDRPDKIVAIYYNENLAQTHMKEAQSEIEGQQFLVKNGLLDPDKLKLQWDPSHPNPHLQTTYHLKIKQVSDQLPQTTLLSVPVKLKESKNGN